MANNKGTQKAIERVIENGATLFVETPYFASEGGESANQAMAILQVAKAKGNIAEREQFDQAMNVLNQIIKSGADLKYFKHHKGGVHFIATFNSITSLLSFYSASTDTASAFSRYTLLLVLNRTSIGKMQDEDVKVQMPMEVLKCLEGTDITVQKIIELEGGQVELFFSAKTVKELQEFKKALENTI